MTLNSVVLPAPLGPMSPVTVPGSTSIETSSRATLPPKRTLHVDGLKQWHERALLVVHGVATGRPRRRGRGVLHGDAVVLGERPVDADELGRRRRVGCRASSSACSLEDGPADRRHEQQVGEGEDHEVQLLMHLGDGQAPDRRPATAIIAPISTGRLIAVEALDDVGDGAAGVLAHGDADGGGHDRHGADEEGEDGLEARVVGPSLVSVFCIARNEHAEQHAGEERPADV